MKVIVAGGTGFIGGYLCWLLERQGHGVVVLSRSAAASQGARKDVLWDGATPGPWETEVDGAGAVINLCGASIAKGRWTKDRKKELRSSRLDSTRALVAAISAAKRKPGVFINGSAIGWYGDRGEETLDEGSPAGKGFLAELCQDWEKEAQKAQEVRVNCLRIGLVLGKGGGALSKMLPPFKLGLGGRLGSGRQWMSWISRDDLCGLILHILTTDSPGPYNGTAPAPVTNQEFTRALGAAVGRPALLPAPGFALKLALGEMSELLLTGQKVLPAKARASGYVFQHPDLATALKASLR